MEVADGVLGVDFEHEPTRIGQSTKGEHEGIVLAPSEAGVVRARSLLAPERELSWQRREIDPSRRAATIEGEKLGQVLLPPSRDRLGVDARHVQAIGRRRSAAHEQYGAQTVDRHTAVANGEWIFFYAGLLRSLGTGSTHGEAAVKTKPHKLISC
jgi:hypothetical protein